MQEACGSRKFPDANFGFAAPANAAGSASRARTLHRAKSRTDDDSGEIDDRRR
jgi:hypothetical protein